MDRANIKMRMEHPPPLAKLPRPNVAPSTCATVVAGLPLRHRPLEILIDLVEETGGGEPFLIGAHQQRKVLGHKARLDGGDRDLLQGRSEFGERVVGVELSAMG